MSTHGRTLATLAATGQPEKHEPFQPLPEGFWHAAWNDLAAFEAVLDPSVGAILVEPLQGEGGVNPADVDFLVGLRRLCDERGMLLILDEIQTGLGRLGARGARCARRGPGPRRRRRRRPRPRPAGPRARARPRRAR